MGVSLRFAILGYLSTGPGTGYDLARQFDTGLGWFWSARHSQIYPELRKLTDAGLVTRDATTVSKHMDKYTYSITDAGLAALSEWAVEPPTYPANRDSERLQLIFSDDSPHALRAHFEAHREHFANRRRWLLETLESIESGTHQRINSRLARGGPEQAALTLRLRELAYRGDIARAELEIEWAQSCLQWLEESDVGGDSTG